MSGVAGKIIVVTGAAGGLGSAYAQDLCARGAVVALVDVRGDAVQEVAEKIRQQSGQAHAFAADLTQSSQVRETLAAIKKRFDRIDVLVNNAGGNLAPIGTMENISETYWDSTIALNLSASWHCAQTVVPWMKEAQYGKIINTATTMVSLGFPNGNIGLASYIAAKGGILGMTRALARELGPFNIMVNCIAPGFIPAHKLSQDSEVSKSARGTKIVEEAVAKQSLRRVGTPQDVSGTIAFLASDDSNFTTGQIFFVDGGTAFN